MIDPLQMELSGGDDESEDRELETGEADVDEVDDADVPDEAENEDGDDAAARAAAGDAVDPVPASSPKTKTGMPASKAPLDPQARDGLIRCLQARITELDATLLHATAVAQKDTFYSRWPNVVSELRNQALKRLEELQRS